MSSTLYTIGGRNRGLGARVRTARRGMSESSTPRVNPRTGIASHRGLGFMTPDWLDYNYDTWSGADPYYYGSPYDFANPGNWESPPIEGGDVWNDFGGDRGQWDTSDPNLYFYTDPNGQRYWLDPWTGSSDVIGGSIDTSEISLGVPIENLTLDLHTPVGEPINPADLYSTLNWWDSLSTTPDTLPITDTDWNAIIAAIPQEYPGPIPGSSSSTANKKSFLNALSQFAKSALNKAATPGAGSPGASGASAKPQTVQPKADGTCPTGYAKHPTTGQCMLIPVKPSENSMSNLLSNPFFLLGAGILIAVIAKK